MYSNQWRSHHQYLTQKRICILHGNNPKIVFEYNIKHPLKKILAAALFKYILNIYVFNRRLQECIL